ncbi:hypothetical protein CcI49_00825 [Frankia sp. CcI49]|nr:hypothetical protein ACG83_01080 [Frankia sp. R43]ONH62626.1 hypothetical protein CcI49_00825 [Frankia sp. CcI49]
MRSGLVRGRLLDATGAGSGQDVGGSWGIRAGAATRRELAAHGGKDLLVPGIPGLPCEHSEQERLQRLALLAGILRKRVPYVFWYVAYGDCNGHACIIAAECRLGKV